MLRFNKITTICILMILELWVWGWQSKPQVGILDPPGELPEIKNWHPDRFLLTFETTPDLDRLSKRLGLDKSRIRLSRETRVAIVDPPDEKIAQVRQKAQSIKEAHFEVDEPVKIFATPNDPQFNQQDDYLRQVNLPSAWDLSKGRSSVVIAIVDTGVNGTHEDLNGKVVNGWNYVTNQGIGANSDSDDHGHGTEVAGVAAAAGNNGKGIAGVDWNASLMPVKVLNSSGEGSTADAVSGIIYAADNGASVINLSFGRTTDSPALKQAIEHAKNRGVIVVAASGNESASQVAYPAAYDDVVAVGAVDRQIQRINFSNYGSALDLVAPGGSILTTADSSNGYVTVSGTSVAAPFVAGVFGLIKDFNANYNADEAKNLLLQNLDKLPAMSGQSRTDEYGNGLLNAHKILLAAASYQAQVVEWSSSDGAYTYPSIIRGEAGTNLVIKLKNSGRSTWNQNVVHLATIGPRDRIPGFLRESQTGAASGWRTANRIKMQESQVAPGETATFSFWVSALADKSPGTYREYFAPVADGITWFSEDLGIYWDVTVLTKEQSYKASPVEWSSSAGAFTYPSLNRGSTGTNLVIRLKNNSKSTWQKGQVNLGTARDRDRIPGFLRESQTGAASGWVSPNRIMMQESQVTPGQTATFDFWMAASQDKGLGTYREYFAPVAEGITWFSEDLGIYWDLKVE